MKVEEIIKLIEFVHKHNISELRIKISNDKVTIKNSDRGCQKQVSKEEQWDEKQLRLSNEKETECDEENLIKAPLVGIFYSAPSAGGENYVNVGDTVVKGQTLAIIEAMKLMNEIVSDKNGIIEKVLVENGQMVEYGQPLFVIEREE